MTITLQSISKIYTRKNALNDISTSFTGGAIHAIVGENGAGKSTLAKILCGDIQPTNGTILFDGRPITIKNQHEAMQFGITTVRQRPLLADSITVLENILLGTELVAKKSQILSRLHELQPIWAPHLSLSAFVYDLGGNDRFYTALLSALCYNPKVLLLDEPTALLSDTERIELYSNLRQAANTGMNIIVITHNMEESTTYTDDVTVLQNGTIQAYYPHSTSFTKDSAGYIDFGHISCNQCSNTQAVSPNNVVKTLAFNHVTVRPINRPALFDISFSVSKGQLTLISGLSEDGLGTLEQLVSGMEESAYNGTLTCDSISLNLAKQPLTPRILRNTQEIHAAIVPSNRTFRGANPHLSVEQIAGAYSPAKSIRSLVNSLIQKAHIDCTPIESGANLSGGMLQRLIIERELATNPDFLILAEPLQGIDSKKSGALCDRLSSLVAKGTGVLVLSSTPFPQSLCTNIYTLSAGKLTCTRGQL